MLISKDEVLYGGGYFQGNLKIFVPCGIDKGYSPRLVV